MHGIWPMAALTLLVATLLGGGVLLALSQRRRYLWLLLPGLPLSALVNLGVKRPLGILVGNALDIPPGLGLSTPVGFLIFLFLLAPVFEEAIKIAPLLVPALRRLVSGRLSGLYVGLGLGLSFGLGEALFLAYGVAQSPQYADLPWYLFTGYAGERLTVTLAHGLLTALVGYGLARGWRGGGRGYLAAVGLHALLNSGAMLYQLGLIGAGLTQLSLLVALFLLVLAFERLRSRALKSSDAEEDEIVYY